MAKEITQPRCSINDIRLKDPEGIARILIAQYGTEDAVEIVARMRRRGEEEWSSITAK